MNETEKQKYIRLETGKLQKLSDIIYYANQISCVITTNIRVVSDYNSKNNLENISNYGLFEAIEEYKTLLTDEEYKSLLRDFGELK